MIGSLFYLTILIITYIKHESTSNVTVLYFVYMMYSTEIACIIFGLLLIVNLLQIMFTFYVALDTVWSFIDEILRGSLSKKMEKVYVKMHSNPWYYEKKVKFLPAYYDMNPILKHIITIILYLINVAVLFLLRIDRSG